MQASYVADTLNYVIALSRSHTNGENKDKSDAVSLHVFLTYRYEFLSVKLHTGYIPLSKRQWKLVFETEDSETSLEAVERN